LKKLESVSIIVPVYNESEAVGGEINSIVNTMGKTNYQYELIVGDDGSTDNTAEIIEKKKKVRLIRHSYNKGVRAARKTGLLRAKGEIVVMTDGDGTYPNQDIPKLLSYMGDYDMVVSARVSRRARGPIMRRPARWFIRKLACYLMGEKMSDLNSGLRVFKKDLAMKFLDVLPEGHSWVSTLTLAFLGSGYTIKYVPIDYYKTKGRSTINPLKDTYNFISLVIRTVMYFNSLKIFLPLATLILVIAIGRIL